MIKELAGILVLLMINGDFSLTMRGLKRVTSLAFYCKLAVSAEDFFDVHD